MCRLNFYEELGISSIASPDEIRAAYRSLARVLHPDNQFDPVLKAMAERQMRRLNAMLGTLTDEDSRRRYDESLLEGRGAGAVAAFRVPDPFPAPKLLEVLIRQPLWLLMGLVVLSSMVWLALQRPRAVAEAGPQQAGSAQTAPVENAVRSKEAVQAIPKRAQVSEAGSPARREGNSKAAESLFAGSWLYIPVLRDEAAGEEAPPQAVQFVLAEHDGNLFGRYSAQYRDRGQGGAAAEVAFVVNGRARSGGLSTLDWSTAEGARGKIQMSVRADGLMNIDWWTTEFGRTAGISSGSAVMTRVR